MFLKPVVLLFLTVVMLKAGPGLMAPSSEKTSDYFCSVGKNLEQRTGKNPRSETPSQLWPYGIVHYSFSLDYDEEGRVQVKKSLDEITSFTCIKFVKVEINSSIPHINYIITSNNQSPLGFQKNKNLNLELEKQSTKKKMVIQHETFHALGLPHEQCRIDRDKHVVISEDNIIEDVKRNFELRDNAYTYDVKYDYESIMHYPPDSFAKNKNKPTIYALINGKKEIRNFGGEEATCSDWLKLNRMYRCSPFTTKFENKCPDYRKYNKI